MPKKRVFEDDRVFYSKPASGARTSRLGDDTLSRIPQPKPREPEAPSARKSEPSGSGTEPSGSGPEPSDSKSTPSYSKGAPSARSEPGGSAPEPSDSGPEPNDSKSTPSSGKSVPGPPPSTLLQRAAGGKPLKDRVGLDRAYDQGDAYVRGDTMYVAGSHYAIDWADDLTRVPFWGDVRKSYRYKQVDKVLDANPQVHNLVGHSLGGSVVHELQRNRPGLRTVTYGTPSVSWRDRGGERYRNGYDPVSMFDRGAVQLSHPNPTSFKGLMHDYHNNENVSSKDGSRGTENPDGTVSITE